MAKRKPVRRATERRRLQNRRQWDFYKELGRFAGLIACASAAVVGQAELIGEPYRHWFTVTAILSTTIWGYCMKPSNLSSFLKRKSN